jgi:DNA-binding PadR family transcriptional regulator
MGPPGKPYSDGGRGQHGHWAGGRVPKGNVRGLLLASLLHGPAHGYELMRRLEEQAGGRWRPSPGSVYPLMQLLEDESLVQSTEYEGRKVYELTPAGREQADQTRLHDLAAGAPAAPAHLDLRAEVDRLCSAARQVGTVGAAAQVEEAVTIVRNARQALYRLLADQ